MQVERVNIDALRISGFQSIFGFIRHTSVWESNITVFNPKNENNNKQLCFVPLLATLAIILDRLFESEKHAYGQKYKLLW